MLAVAARRVAAPANKFPDPVPAWAVPACALLARAVPARAVPARAVPARAVLANAAPPSAAPAASAASTPTAAPRLTARGILLPCPCRLWCMTAFLPIIRARPCQPARKRLASWPIACGPAVGGVGGIGRVRVIRQSLTGGGSSARAANREEGDVPRAWQASLLRARSGTQRVTNVELFFDLVYVFAVTQLSHHLLGNPSVEGALQTVLLLVFVWLAWAYTTWVTNWLDPERIAVRLMLVTLMLVSLVMSAALPEAFTARGLAVGGGYAAMQVGRSVFAVAALRGERLQRNFERILAWCLVPGQRHPRCGGRGRPWPRTRTALGARGRRRPARQLGRLLHARPRPVQDQ